MNLATLTVPHSRFPGSVLWRLAPDGIRICLPTDTEGPGAPPETTGGEPSTVRRIWETWGEKIEYHAYAASVPVELIVATIATESGGDASAVRLEPGYVSDAETPHRVSPGLMQALISTAREALRNPLVDRDYLLRPEGSIEAGTAYIAQQAARTGFDPPLVASAYNAGSVREDRAEANRWRLFCYPPGTGKHVTRWVMWFNDTARFFRAEGFAPAGSFAEALRGVAT